MMLKVKTSLANAATLLASVMARDASALRYSVATYIAKDVYESLPPRYRDLYHAPIQLPNSSVIVHERFSQDSPICFVISPIGPEGGEIRQRADHVFETYIKPACENTELLGLRPVRGEMMHGINITPELKEALRAAPMVIVYLGPAKPGFSPDEMLFNSNVVFEFGIRDAAGAPYVVIKDEEYKLPFDFKDVRVLDIPPQAKETQDLTAVKIRTIRDQINEGLGKAPRWNYSYPGSTVDIEMGGEEAPRFTEASKELEELFEMKGIAGKDADFVSRHVLQKMPPYQREPFKKDQNRVLGELLQKKKQSEDPYTFEQQFQLFSKPIKSLLAAHFCQLL